MRLSRMTVLWIVRYVPPPVSANTAMRECCGAVRRTSVTAVKPDGRRNRDPPRYAGATVWLIAACSIMVALGHHLLGPVARRIVALGAVALAALPAS